jgi:hypothetical protein
MSAAALPDAILLEDANDLCVMLVAAGRAIDPSKWVDASIDDDGEA